MNELRVRHLSLWCAILHHLNLKNCDRNRMHSRDGVMHHDATTLIGNSTFSPVPCRQKPYCSACNSLVGWEESCHPVGAVMHQQWSPMVGMLIRSRECPHVSCRTPCVRNSAACARSHGWRDTVLQSPNAYRMQHCGMTSSRSSGILRRGCWHDGGDGSSS